MDDGSASVFCFNPIRVSVSELDRLRAAPSPPESWPAPLCSAPSIPHSPCPVCPRLEQEFEPWRQAAYWKAQHRRVLEREAKLQAEIDRLQALVRLREQQLFGRKTEAAAATPSAAPLATPADPPPRRPRGQQPGKPGPKRRDYSHLPGRCCMKGKAPESDVLPPHSQGSRLHSHALRPPLMSHDVQRPAADSRLGGLPGRSSTRHAVAEDRLHPEHRRLHQRTLVIA
jgi:hypothetical protein